jgi:hypothetical protein
VSVSAPKAVDKITAKASNADFPIRRSKDMAGRSCGESVDRVRPTLFRAILMPGHEG